jgi:hypothetical protein
MERFPASVNSTWQALKTFDNKSATQFPTSMKQNLFLLTIVSSLLLSSYAQADDNTTLQKRLKSGDSDFRQGTYVYKHVPKSGFYKMSLSYSPQRKFVLEQRTFGNANLTGRELPPHVRQVFDGRDQYLFFRSSNPKSRSYVDIQSGSPDEVTEKYLWTGGLCPMPCWVFGRGLAQLQNIRIVKQTKSQIVVWGKTAIGSTVTAILDPAHNLVATRIDHSRKAKLFQRIILEKPVKVGKSGWLASSAKTYRVRGQNFELISTYSLLKANASAPAVSTFEARIPKGWLADDRRHGKAITWDMKNEGSGRALSPRTKGKIEELARNVSERTAKQNKQRTLQIAFLLSPFCLLIGLATWKWQNNRSQQHK